MKLEIETPHQSGLDDSDSWFDAAPDTTEKEEVIRRQMRDVDIQCEIETVQSSHVETQTFG